ncbi:MAG: PAS domain S-box protein [Candidatus Omnitrophota bacterium]|nr:PAS domain S-box protein [Candidatus Omnitrophota bacterium]MDZ4243237.1 PAS domain S-box protein [Candidatus Omnitrophota bacterium]
MIPYSNGLQTVADLKFGDHICQIFSTEEEFFAVLEVFLLQGLRNKEKVVYSLDAYPPEKIYGLLQKAGVDVDGCRASGQLHILNAQELYQKDGKFDPEAIVASLKALVRLSQEQGFKGLRVAGEAGLILKGGPGSEKLIEYEVKVQELFHHNRIVALCQYDRNRFPASVIAKILTTHPVIIIGAKVYENFFYVPADSAEHLDNDEVVVHHWLKSLEVHAKLTENLRDIAKFPTQSPNPTMRIGADGTVLFANQSCQPLLKEWILNAGGQLPDPWRHYVKDGLASGKTTKGVEFVGGGQQYSFTIVPVPEFNYVNFFGTDVTELKAVEERLRQFQRQQKAILDNIPDMAWLKDAESRFIMVNEAIARASGAPAEKMAGKTDLDFYPQDLAEHYRADDREVIASGKSKFVEELFEEAGGKRKWIETIKTPIFDDSGRVVGTAGIARDVTERKRIEDELRKLSQAIEQSPSSIMITDVQGKLEYVNPRFCQVTGYSSSEVLGKNPRFLKSGETSPGHYRQMWMALTSGQEWRGVFHNKRKNGELFWESAALSPIRDEKGRITHFLGIKEDISERKRMEDELQASFEDLRRFKELTIDRENKMIELKREINQLYAQLGKPSLYNLSDLDEVNPTLNP